MKKTPKQKLKEECVSIASEKKLEKHPRCALCNKPAQVCHHFIHQGRSNYLRCDEKNLIPLCVKHHYLLHNGYEQIYALHFRAIYGDKWAEGLVEDSRKQIKDTMTYWRKLKQHLTNNEI